MCDILSQLFMLCMYTVRCTIHILKNSCMQVPNSALLTCPLDDMTGKDFMDPSTDKS